MAKNKRSTKSTAQDPNDNRILRIRSPRDMFCMRMIVLLSITMIFNLAIIGFGQVFTGDKKWKAFAQSVQEVSASWFRDTYGNRVVTTVEPIGNKPLPPDLGIGMADAIMRSKNVEISLDPDTGDIMQRFYTDKETVGEMQHPNNPVEITNVPDMGYYIFAITRKQTRASFEAFLNGDPNWEIGVGLHLPGQIDRPPTSDSVVSKFRNEVKMVYDQKTNATSRSSWLSTALTFFPVAVIATFAFIWMGPQAKKNAKAKIREMRRAAYLRKNPEMNVKPAAQQPEVCKTRFRKPPKPPAQEIHISINPIKPPPPETYKYGKVLTRYENLVDQLKKTTKLGSKQVIMEKLIAEAAGHHTAAEKNYKAGNIGSAVPIIQRAVSCMEEAKAL